MEEEEVRKMKVVELRDQLKMISKPINGLKAKLIEPLVDYYHTIVPDFFRVSDSCSGLGRSTRRTMYKNGVKK